MNYASTPALATTLVAIVLSLSAVAQDPERPAVREELWVSFAVKGKPSFLKPLLGKKTTKKLRYAGELGYRSGDSFFAGRQVYCDLGFTYKVNKHLDISTEGRYAQRSEGPNRQRVAVKLAYGRKIDRLELDYRFTFQHDFRPQAKDRNIFRNKFAASYNFRNWKLDPKISVEFFQRIGQQELLYFGTRYKLGVDWSPADGHTFDLALVHDRERGVYAPEYRVITAIGYSLDLRKI